LGDGTEDPSVEFSKEEKKYWRVEEKLIVVTFRFGKRHERVI
jgi:hypothetical protein